MSSIQLRSTNVQLLPGYIDKRFLSLINVSNKLSESFLKVYKCVELFLNEQFNILILSDINDKTLNVTDINDKHFQTCFIIF